LQTRFLQTPLVFKARKGENMKNAKKHAALLFALAIPVLIVGCKPRPAAFGAWPSAAEARDADNPFVGIWICDYPYPLSIKYHPFIYKFTDAGRWEYYEAWGGAITPGWPTSKGTYAYKDHYLYVYEKVVGFNIGPWSSPRVWRLKFDGGVIRSARSALDYVQRDRPLRRVSADDVVKFPQLRELVE
jgi:hypothetical protein